MATSLKEVPREAGAKRLFDQTAPGEILATTHTQEVIIALCGPVGSPLHDVANKICDLLRQPFGYEECQTILLSEFIVEHARKSSRTIGGDETERRQNLINLGNEMRGAYGESILAELAINKIRIDRETKVKNHESGQFLSRRVCYIIDSIKNQKELDLLRIVYREALYVIGVFAPLSMRKDNLAAKGMNSSQIEALIDRDSGEEIYGGQTVAKTFPQSDFFLCVDSNTNSQLGARLERFLHLIMGSKVLTPTKSEAAMYAAAAAATHSACLSRQVGAAVTDEDGELLSIGWNDVPKPFGDLYVTDLDIDPNSDRDKRCWNYGGKCYNDEEKTILANHIIDALSECVRPEKKAQAVATLVENKKIRSLIEFSRSIHAEMHAILTALKYKGSRVSGGRIYVTTYPCHSCARHIVAAGIKEVYYIEPYKKSLATKLHGDAITEEIESKNKVILIPYDGVAPTRYLQLFRMIPDTRKENGRVMIIDPQRARPKLEKSLEALPSLEAVVVKSLQDRKITE